MNKPTIKEGPLTHRQIQILDGLLAGHTQKYIAARLKAPVPADGTPTPAYGVNVSVVRQEVATIKTKMGADSTAQAVAQYAMALTYRTASAEVLDGRVTRPLDDAERHMNQVLEEFADRFQHQASEGLPR